MSDQEQQFGELFDNILSCVMEQNLANNLIKSAEESGNPETVRTMKAIPIIAKRHNIRISEILAILFELGAINSTED